MVIAYTVIDFLRCRQLITLSLRFASHQSPFADALHFMPPRRHAEPLLFADIFASAAIQLL